MTREFIIYYRDKIIGGIYDARLLVKAVPTAIAYMSNASYELPHEGAKEMLLVDEVDDKVQHSLNLHLRLVRNVKLKRVLG